MDRPKHYANNYKKKRLIFRKKDCQEKKTKESKENKMKDDYKQNRQEQGEERKRK